MSYTYVCYASFDRIRVNGPWETFNYGRKGGTSAPVFGDRCAKDFGPNLVVSNSCTTSIGARRILASRIVISGESSRVPTKKKNVFKGRSILAYTRVPRYDFHSSSGVPKFVVFNRGTRTVENVRFFSRDIFRLIPN